MEEGQSLASHRSLGPEPESDPALRPLLGAGSLAPAKDGLLARVLVAHTQADEEPGLLLLFLLLHVEV